VLGLVAEGRSNKEIAAEFIISEHTAKYHVTSLLDKLGADSRVQAVALAAQRGLLGANGGTAREPARSIAALNRGGRSSASALAGASRACAHR